MAFKMKGFVPFTQKDDKKEVKSTISNQKAKGINVENISAVQSKGGKKFVVETDKNEYYDPNAKNSIGGKDDKWDSNYNDTNNKRDTVVVSNRYKKGDLIDETEWETGKATKKKKSALKQGMLKPMPKNWKGTKQEWLDKQGKINKEFIKQIRKNKKVELAKFRPQKKTALKQRDYSKTTTGGKIHAAIMTAGDVLTSSKPKSKLKNYKKYKQDHRNRKRGQINGMYLAKPSHVSR